MTKEEDLLTIDSQIFKILTINDEKRKVLATSYSQIDVFLSCKYRWYRDYLLSERVMFTSEATCLGSAIHETLEQYFLSQKDNKTLSLGKAQGLLFDKLDENNIPYANQENQDVAEEQHEEMIRKLVNGSGELAEFMSDKEVIACEKEFVYKVDLPFKVLFNKEEYDEIYVIGSIDLVVKDNDGGIYVVDFKSGKRTFTPKKLKENLQLPIYSLVILEQYGRLPIGVSYYFTRFDKLQHALPIALNDNECKHVYFKNGNVKQYQKTVPQIKKEMIDIFECQYVKCEREANKSPLCSWCNHSPLYGEIRNCKYAMKFMRKDIPVPKRKKRSVKAVKC